MGAVAVGRITINSNILALSAQRGLAHATSGVSSAVERLSSGQRINRASDDAAGLAIASSLHAGARLFSQAIRNISDGLSATSIASSAYKSLSDLSARMKELAEQSANGVYSIRQREALDDELQALIAEHNRIINTTRFNGEQLLTGSSRPLELQVGITSGAESVLSVEAYTYIAEQVGSGTFQAAASYATANGPTAIVSADFNGDGRSDVVSANGGAGSVSVLLAQADGTLGAASNVAVGSNPVDIATGDFNGDGHMDLVTADNGSGSGTTASILLNNGSGGFSAGAALVAGTGPLAVTTGDVNNDGIVDIVTAATGGGSAASANFGSGTAEISSVTTPGMGAAEVTAVTVVGAPVREVTQMVAATAGGGAGTNEVTRIVADAAGGGGGTPASYVLSYFGGSENFAPLGGPGTQAQYFTLSTPSQNFYVWYDITPPFGPAQDPAFTEPLLAGYTGITITMTPGLPLEAIASITASAIDTNTGGAFSVVDDGMGSVTVVSNELGEVSGLVLSMGPAFGLSYDSGTDGSGGAVNAGDYFLISSPTTTYALWFNVDGMGSGPAVPGTTNVQVNVASTDDSTQVATKLQAALLGIGGGAVFSVARAGDTLDVISIATGNTTDATDVSVGGAFSVTTQVQGSSGGGGPIAAGDYFFLNSATTQYYGWYRVDGAGSDPGIAGRTGIMIDILSTDDASQVATKMKTAFDALGGNPFTTTRVNDTLTITNNIGGAVADASDVNVGAPFAITTTTQGTSTGLTPGSYFTIDTPSTDYYVWFNIGGTGADPMVAGRTGLQVNLNWGDDASTVASAIAAVVNPVAPVNASASLGTVTITNTAVGVGSVGAGTTSNFNIVTQTDGAAAGIASGQYFLLSSPTTNYYAWYNVDGAGGDPLVAGRTGIQINVSSGQTAAQVASATAAAIDALADFASSSVGGNLSIVNAASGAVADISAGTMGGGFSANVTTQGVNSSVNVGADTISIAGHGFSTGEAVTLSTTGTLPGGLSPATTYYVIADDANTIRLATSAINAGAGTAIDLTSGGSGTQTIQGSGAAAGVRVFLGVGDGSFQSPLAFNLGTNPVDIAFGDLDGDGNLDLVSVDQTQNVIRTQFGRGDGTFQAAISYTTGSTPRAIAVGDLNNDGRADVVSVDSGSNTLSVFLSDASGRLGPRISIATGNDPRSVSIGDMNGDGVPDIIAGYNGDGAVGVFLNDTRGAFTSLGTFAAGTGTRATALGDVNGDGVLDIIAGNNGSNNVTVGIAETSSSTTLAVFNIRTQQSARDALEIVTALQQRINTQQGVLGAAESRLQTMVSVQQVSRENYSAAESRIKDADIAAESASLVRNSILQQAAQAVLAQAGVQPELALTLLGR